MMREKRSLIRSLVIAIVFVVCFLGLSTVVHASCKGTPDDCHRTCDPGYEWYLSDCRWRATKLINIFNDCLDSSLGVYEDECEDEDDNDGDYYCNDQGSSVQIMCYVDTSGGKIWNEDVEKVCSCVVAAGPPSEADAVAEDLGLTDISIKGIFAGELSIDQMVQFILLMVLSIITVVILFLIIINGMKIAGSGDDEQKKQSGVKGITNAIIGLVIILASYLILSFFFSFFGLSPFKKIIPVDCAGLEGEALDRCMDLVDSD